MLYLITSENFKNKIMKIRLVKKIMELFNDKVIVGIMFLSIAFLIIIVLGVYIYIVYHSISIILSTLALLIATGIEKICKEIYWK